MPASKQTYIMGERFWLVKENISKAEAGKLADKERRSGYKARVVRLGRKYLVWSTRRFGYLS